MTGPDRACCTVHLDCEQGHETCGYSYIYPTICLENLQSPDSHLFGSLVVVVRQLFRLQRYGESADTYTKIVKEVDTAVSHFFSALMMEIRRQS